MMNHFSIADCRSGDALRARRLRIAELKRGESSSIPDSQRANRASQSRAILNTRNPHDLLIAGSSIRN
jgi:predicted nucleic acid-binding protein